MKKKINILLILFIILASICGIYTVSTFAKYTSNSAWNYYLKSQGFYFESDDLSAEGKESVNTLWDGNSVTFNVRNNLNQTLITDYDINYTASCEVLGDAKDNLKCILNGVDSSITGTLSKFQTCINATNNGVDVSNLSKTDCELSGYSWQKQIAKKELYFDIIKTNENYEISDVDVKVIVSSTSPYKKTLTGNFKLHKGEIEVGEISAVYNNYTDYNRLIITNSYTNDKCVKVSWDSTKQLIDIDSLDVSSYLTDNEGFIKEIKFNINGKNSISYIFYNKGMNNSDINNFVIEESSGC